MPMTDFTRDPYLCLLRPLVEAYLALYRLGTRHIEGMGLTPSQFDVIAERGSPTWSRRSMHCSAAGSAMRWAIFSAGGQR